VNFFDGKGLVDEIASLIDSPQERARLGANARTFARETYDLRSTCLPRQLEWVRSIGR